MIIELKRVRIKDCQCNLSGREALEKLREAMRKYFGTKDILFEYETKVEGGRK